MTEGSEGSIVPAGAAPPAKHRLIPENWTAGTWARAASGIGAFVIVLVFILQNLDSVKVSFLTAHWKIPLGLDLLISAFLGGVLVFLAGSLRILQHRLHLRRHGERDGRKR